MNAPRQSLMLWSGRPNVRALRRRVCQTPAVALYFAVLLIDGAAVAARGGGADPGWVGEAKLLAMWLLTFALQVLLAWLMHKTTVYDITAREVVLRYGVALPRKLVIPFGAIMEVKLRVNRDGTGDLGLRLKEGQAIAYLKLWPHVRAWSFGAPEPMLRALNEPGVVASALCRAIEADAAARATEERARVAHPIELRRDEVSSI